MTRRDWITAGFVTGIVTLGLAGFAVANTLTGAFVTPMSGAVANGTLLLTLSQAATVPGSFAVVPQTVSCATSSDGSVVGVNNPLATPLGSAYPGVGTLAAGNYFVEIAYTAALGTVSLPSPEQVLALNAAGELVINAPALRPAAATGYQVYIGTASGAETLQGAVSGWGSYTQSSALTAGAALPTQNTTLCTLTFNDQTIPSDTYYTATLEDSAGNTLPGYPQNWYLAGSTVNVSNLEPLASNPAVRFPQPILSNPASALEPQSLNSPLNMNLHLIENSANVGPGFFSSFYAGTLPGPTTAIGGWTPNTAVNLQRMDLYAQTAGAGGTSGLNVAVTDGTSTCTFQQMLAAAATVATAVPEAGSVCTFNAGVALTVNVSSDDHTTRPGNVAWQIEMTAK